MEFFVIHQPDDGVKAVQFAAPIPACMIGASWVADDIPPGFLTIGDTQIGMAVSYGLCLTAPIHVATMIVTTTGATTPDCAFPIVPDPASLIGHIEVVDCAQNKHIGTGGIAYVNSSLACLCGPGSDGQVLDVPPVVTFGENDNSMPLSISNVGTGTLNWQVSGISWLTATPSAGTGDQTITLDVDRSSIPDGHYDSYLWVASNGGNASVTVEVPVLGLSTTGLHFPDPVTTRAFRAGASGPLSWSIDPPLEGWLSVNPAAGVGWQTVQVLVDRTGLAPGLHDAILHVRSDFGDREVYVTMEVGNNAWLGYSPASLDFGSVSTHETLNIFNNGTGVLSWGITPMASWASVDPPSGTGNASVNVSVDRSNLAVGTHTTVLAISSNGGSAQVPVSLIVEASTPTLGVSPTSLSFTPGQSQKGLNIFNTGPGTLTWAVTDDVPWLTAQPGSGSNNAALTVTVDRTGLADGTYNGAIHIASNGGDADIPVTMIVDSTPVLSVNPQLLIYDNFTTTRSFQITNAGGGTLDWQLSADRTWISIAPPLTGSGSATVTVSIDLSQIPGTQIETGFVTISSNGGVQAVEIRYNPPSGVGTAGAVILYTDPGYTSCNIQDVAGPITIYTVHDLHDGASAVQYASPVPPCWTGAVFVADESPFLTIGSSQEGIAISYGSCLAGPVIVNTMTILSQGLGPQCCAFDVVPDPAALTGQIEGVDCALNTTFPSGGAAVINVDASCPCGLILHVETKTWGAVKALYAPDHDD